MTSSQSVLAIGGEALRVLSQRMLCREGGQGPCCQTLLVMVGHAILYSLRCMRRPSTHSLGGATVRFLAWKKKCANRRAESEFGTFDADRGLRGLDLFMARVLGKTRCVDAKSQEKS